MFKSENSRFNIVKEEEKVLKFWKDNNIFKRSVKAREKGKPFVFYEGPPTANGRPGIHHVLTRAFKDVMLRYKTMRGFWAWRRAGWDTHGLPVEIEVEKELGLKNKKEIEEYGIAKFNAKCRESVWRYKEDWEKLTERMGFWIDMDDPYITYDADYIENLWAIIKKFYDKGLLSEDFKVVPYCVRCGTAISSHEVAQGYETVTDRSITVEFQVKGKKDTSLLAWTTTPWTLPGNVALAVNPDVTYVEIEKKDMGVGKMVRFILAKDKLTEIFGSDDYSIIKEYKGKDLVGLEYEPLFDVKELKSDKSYKVYGADFVNTEEGTGIVHTAVMYGVDDFELGTKEGLPKFHTVDEDGKFVLSLSVVGGHPVVKNQKKDLETEELIINYLKEKNLLFKEEKYEHEYPFCWRCNSPLLYYARNSWFINVTKRKNDLIRNNKKINWIPENVKEGRFGEWLNGVKDWAFSRDRYWGTPLPIWRCQNKDCSHKEVIGSLKELNENRLDSPTKFFLLRHGQSLSNEKNIASSWPETFENNLTEKGKIQVVNVIKDLKREKIDIIYSSDLTRTLQTADMVAAELDIQVKIDERLREVDVGEFNGKSTADYYNFFTFLRERLFKEPKGGEDWIDVRKRMWGFTHEIKERHPGQKVLIVSHGLPLALMESTLRGIETDELLVWQEQNELENADVHSVDFPNWPFSDAGEIDLHRPYIDKIELKCPKCEAKMKRVPEVIDAWFDSGAVPFAQPSFAKATEGKAILKRGLGEALDGQFPADYIAEGMDQTRGWFYTLHAISTLLGKGPSYKNVVVNGLVLDEKGKKMSKSVGNVVDPWEVINKYGIDALRWYFFTVNAPGDAKLFNEKDIKERHRRFVMTVINSLVFLETYFTPSGVEGWSKPNASNHPLDQWIYSRLAEEIKGITGRMDKFHFIGSARRLDSLVQDISNWYIRRSRSHLQDPNNTSEKFATQETLWNVLYNLSLLLAPFTPFLAETVFLRLKKLSADDLPESVHFSDWPNERGFKRQERLEEGMNMVRSLASVALAERAKEGIKVRQKLNMLALNKDDAKKIRGLEELLKDEVNVDIIESLEGISVGEVRLDTNITPELLREGVFREIVRAVNDLRKEAGLTPKDQIKLYLEVKNPDGKTDDFSDLTEELKKETRAGKVVLGKEKEESFDKERSFKDRGWEIWVGIKKI